MFSHPDFDPLLMDSPLRRPRTCRRIIAFLVLVLAFSVFIHSGLFASMRPDVAAVFLRALALSTVLASVPLALLWYLDRRERETPWLFAAAFLWGGCIATAISVPINTSFFSSIDAAIAREPMILEVLGPDAAALLSAPISAPIVEEIAKALGVILIFWLLRAEFDSMRDGIVYGALVGAGFNWFEAALYVSQGYFETGVAPFGFQLGSRYAGFGLGGHAMYTGIFGAFLGISMQTQRLWLRVVAPIAGLAVAMSAHALNNALPLYAALADAAQGAPPLDSEVIPNLGFVEAFISSTTLGLGIFLPFVLTGTFLLWRSGLWERRVIREELSEEVGPVISPGEYRAILADRMFRTRRIEEKHPHISARMVNAQNELAFRKRRVRIEGGDLDQDRLVALWRTEIRRLRAATSHDE
jgi:protease PrsW